METREKKFLRGTSIEHLQKNLDKRKSLVYTADKLKEQVFFNGQTYQRKQQ
jgi:hypothetical protein